jgi:alpha/beta superfamily hydrolase
MKSADVQLVTSDGMQIAGTYIPGSLPFGIVLLHMMPAVRGSYATFASELSESDYHTLAIDLRGHGESGGGDYQNFTDEQHQKSIMDVLAAVDYLHKQNPNMKIGMVGASIGANLALQYAAANPTAFVVLLSPGLNYRGIETGRMAVAVPEDLPMYFVTALDDNRVEGNSNQTETLYNACSSTKKSIQIFREGGHGTDIIARNPDFRRSLLEWMKEASVLEAPAQAG